VGSSLEVWVLGHGKILIFYKSLEVHVLQLGWNFA